MTRRVDEAPDVGAVAVPATRALPDERRTRTRLLELLVHGGHAAGAAAGQLSWGLQPVLTVVELVSAGLGPDDAERVSAALFGAGALCGPLGDRWLVVVPAEVDPDDLRVRIGGLGRELLILVGPPVPPDLVAVAARLVLRLRAIPDVRARAVNGVVRCADHLLDLVVQDAKDTVRVLGADVLEPLAALSPTKRVKYARLLSAWLEFGSLHGDAPGVLDKHRQTLRYQRVQLQRMFGDALHDRRARLELMIALRAVLPVWEQQGSDRG